MRQQLLNKLQKEHINYTDKEVEWLINHIGDCDSKIRDDLVCETFGKGFLNEEFSRNQVSFLTEYVLNKNLLFYKIEQQGEATLTRSFTCLLLELIIQTNGDKNSDYYKILSKVEQRKLILNLLDYLKLEHDFTGYSEKFGWVDAISHLADAFEVSFAQNVFSKEYSKLFLDNLNVLLLKVKHRFVNGEEWRISNSLFAAIKNSKISNNALCAWIAKIEFDNSNELVKLYQFENLKSILLDLYIKLEEANLLEKNLRQKIISDYLKKY